MAGPIRSGLRDVQPTDYGVGSVVRDLQYSRQRKDMKADRDFHMKLQDQQFVDNTLLELSKEGVVINDTKVEEIRDKLANTPGDVNSKEYRKLKTDLFTEVQQANAKHRKFMESFQYLSQEMGKNPQYWKRESFQKVQQALANRDLEALDDVVMNGKNAERILHDMMSDQIQMTQMFEDKMIGDNLVSRGGVGSSDLHYIDDNGRLVNREVEQINIQAFNDWSRGEGGIDPDVYRMLKNEAYQRLIDSEDNGDGSWGKMSESDQIKTLLFEKAFAKFKPQQAQTRGFRVDYDSKTSNPSYFKWIQNEENKQNMIGWFKSRNEAAINNQFGKYGIKLEFSDEDPDTGRYNIKVLKLVKDRRGKMVWDEENAQTKIIDPNDLSTITSTIGGFGEDVGSADGSISPNQNEELTLEEQVANAQVGDIVAGRRYVGGDKTKPESWEEVE